MVCLDQELLMKSNLSIFAFVPWAIAFLGLCNVHLTFDNLDKFTDSLPGGESLFIKWRMRTGLKCQI